MREHVSFRHPSLAAFDGTRYAIALSAHHRDATNRWRTHGTGQSRRHLVRIPAGAGIELAITAPGHAPAARTNARVGRHARWTEEGRGRWRRTKEDHLQRRPQEDDRPQEDHWPQEDD